MKKTAALFPGQGSQSVGMIKELRENFPQTKLLFEEASDRLKINMVKLCLEGPESDLQLTFHAQPAILMTSVAWFQVLKETTGFDPAMGAGHSLGEYSALTAGGALTFSEAIPLVHQRGTLMQKAVPKGQGKMAAIMGLSADKLELLCQLASQSNSLVSPANWNSPEQVVIAGNVEAVDRAIELASGKDSAHPELKAKRALPLNVSAPFHCALMQPVAEQFKVDLEKIKWQNSRFPIVSNVDASPRTGSGEWVPTLTQQIDHPVKWVQCVEKLVASGVERVVEVGPGKVLSGLVKRITGQVEIVSVDSIEALKKLEVLNET